MKKKLSTTLALLLLWPASVGWATDYYVREDGTAASKETAVDCLLANTAMSVATHNAETFAPGDNIYLCDDVDISAQIVPPSSGSGGNYITYDGDSDNDGVDAEVQGGIAKGTKIDYLKFANIHFTTSTKGLSLAAGASNNWVTGCFFDTLGQQGIFSSGLANTAYSQDWLIENCVFTNVGAYGDTAAADINVGGFSRRWTIRNTTHTGDGSTRGVDGVNFSNVNVTGGDGSGHLLEHITCSGYQENCADFKGTRESAAGEGGTVVQDCDFSAGGGTEGLTHIQFNAAGVTYRRVKFHDHPSNAIASPSQGVGEDASGYIVVDHCLFQEIRKSVFSDRGLINDEALGHNTFLNNTFINCGDNLSGYAIDIGSNYNTLKNNLYYNVSENATSDIIYRFEAIDNYTTADIDYNDNFKLSQVGTQVALVVATQKYWSTWQADGNDANGWLNLDPHLDSKGRPTAKTPAAIKRGGALLDGQPSIAGKWGYIGAYPYYEGTITPWNIALSIMGGPGRLGGGTVYTAPAEEYLGNYFLDGTTVFLDGSTYFVDGGL